MLSQPAADLRVVCMIFLDLLEGVYLTAHRERLLFVREVDAATPV